MHRRDRGVQRDIVVDGTFDSSADAGMGKMYPVTRGDEMPRVLPCDLATAAALIQKQDGDVHDESGGEHRRMDRTRHRERRGERIAAPLRAPPGRVEFVEIPREPFRCAGDPARSRGMNIHLPNPVSLALLFCLATPCIAQQPPIESEPVATEGSAPESAKKDMKGINRAAKAIGKFLKDPKGEAPMEQVATLQKLAMSAEFRTPSLAAKQPEAERTAFVKAYRKQINTLIRGSLDLEEAMEAKDWAKAGKALEAMNDAKQTGHKKFKPKRKRRR